MTTITLEQFQVEELVGQAKAGNEAAFSELYQQFASKIFRFIRMKISNLQDAEDLLQTVFYKTFRGLKSLRPGKINFAGWLFKIASNSINDYFRKSYRTPVILGITENFDLPDTKKSVEQQIAIKSDFELADKVFSGLPPLYKEVLEQRLLLDRPLAEVAKALHKTPTSVRVAQCRALKKARVALAQEIIK